MMNFNLELTESELYTIAVLIADGFFDFQREAEHWRIIDPAKSKIAENDFENVSKIIEKINEIYGENIESNEEND